MRVGASGKGRGLDERRRKPRRRGREGARGGAAANDAPRGMRAGGGSWRIGGIERATRGQGKRKRGEKTGPKVEMGEEGKAAAKMLEKKKRKSIGERAGGARGRSSRNRGRAIRAEGGARASRLPRAEVARLSPRNGMFSGASRRAPASVQGRGSLERLERYAASEKKKGGVGRERGRGAAKRGGEGE